MTSLNHERPGYERVAHEQRHMFQLGRASLNTLKRLNVAVICELDEYTAGNTDYGDPIPGADDESLLESIFHAAIAGIAEDGDPDRAKEIITGFQFANDPHWQEVFDTTACKAAYYLGSTEYAFSSSVLLERYLNSESAWDMAGVCLLGLRKRVTPEQGADLGVRIEQVEAARIAAGKPV
ncbi:hypothetical protein IU459_15695 [Nocardia amamiensis]|uniref:Uncharacterized protein n=1 Tax=Nocardia amamiensis TaxID=404578 RepID=A0ABS0CRQ7_9NOCA|nr:hypothetical protein [Nocardia amamiensis]MBF6298976.1 hypothetical protein [Nocardia amamiensis]